MHVKEEKNCLHKEWRPAACGGKVFWWRELPGILAWKHHPSTPATGYSQKQRLFLPVVWLKDCALRATPKFKFQQQCPPTQIPARQSRNQPYLKRSIRSGNFQSITKDWERDKTHRVSCYFAFQRVNKRLIQWEERRTSSSSAVLSSWTSSSQSKGWVPLGIGTVILGWSSLSICSAKE